MNRARDSSACLGFKDIPFVKGRRFGLRWQFLTLEYESKFNTSVLQYSSRGYAFDGCGGCFCSAGYL